MNDTKPDPWFSDEEERLDFEVELFYLSVAEKIARLMRAQEITRTELARKLGVSKPFITKVLSGEANLTLRSMYRIFYHLGCKVDLKPAKYVAELDYTGEGAPQEPSLTFNTIPTRMKGAYFKPVATPESEERLVEDDFFSAAA